MAGLDVTPRSDSSRISRSSSPLVMRGGRIWSSQMLVPPAVSAASLSLTACPTLIASLLSGRSCCEPLHDRPAALGDALGREAKVLVEVSVWCRPPKGRHADCLAVLRRPGGPAERRGRLHRDSRPHGGR